MKRIIFLHGVGGTGAGLRPLAEALETGLDCHFPDGPLRFDGDRSGIARQWFSITGVTEDNRPARIAQAMPGFCAMLQDLGDPRDSLLVGFSQGAIMALHAVAQGLPVAGVVALSGRLAGPVAPRKEWPAIWLLHGQEDRVMPPDLAQRTRSWLREAGADPRLTLFADLGHAIDARSLDVLRGIIAKP